MNKAPPTCRPLTTIATHSEIKACAFSPTGGILASAAGNGALTLWEIPAGIEVISLRGSQSSLNDCRFSPDGRWAVAASNDTTCWVWDLHGWQSMRRLKGHNDPVVACAISPDGSRILSGDLRGDLICWNVTDTASERVSGGLDSRKPDVAYFYSPNGSQLVAVSAAAKHPGRITSCAFSPDGQFLIAGWDKSVTVFSATNKKDVLHVERDSAPFISCEFSPTVETVAIASRDSRIVLWNVRTRAEVATLNHGGEEIAAFAFSPDGCQIASACRSGTLQLWDVRHATQLATLRLYDAPLTACAFSPDGSHLAVGSYGRLYLYHVPDIIASSNRAPGSLWTDVYAVSRDGAQAVGLASGDHLACANTHDGSLGLALHGQISRRLKLVARRLKPVAALSADGSRVAYTDEFSQDLCVRDLRNPMSVCTRYRARTESGESSELTACKFSPDGSRVVGAWHIPSRAQPRGQLMVFDVMTCDKVTEVATGAIRVRRCAFSSDTRRLVAITGVRIVIWDVADGRVVGKTKPPALRPYEKAVTPRECVFSADNKRVLSFWSDNTLRSWDLAGEAEAAVAELGAGSEPITGSCSFCGDGRYFAARGLWSDCVRIWETASGAEIATYPGARGHFSWLPGSPRLVVAGTDGSIHLLSVQMPREDDRGRCAREGTGTDGCQTCNG